MPVPLTKAQLLAEATRARIEGLALIEYADSLEQLAKKAPLTHGDDAGTVETQMHVESAGAGRSKGQMAESSRAHPFGKMLERRKTTVADVAKFLTGKLKRDVPRSTVQAWYKDPEDAGYRPIRKDAAEALKAEYGVPLNAWHRVRE